MRERGLVEAQSFGECGQKTHDPMPEVNGQTEDRPELDHDREHFPVAVAKIDMEQRFRDTQVRSRTDGQKLSEALDNAEEDGKKIVVQTPPMLPRRWRAGHAPVKMGMWRTSYRRDG